MEDFAELQAVLSSAMTKLAKIRERLSSQPEIRDGLNAVTGLVDVFHRQVALALPDWLDYGKDDEAVVSLLEHASATLSTLAEEFEKHVHSGDKRGLRAHLLLEELAELLSGMRDRDVEKALDATADLEYVLHGTACTLGLPLGEALVEVHKSNMTKRRQSSDPKADRVRDKGPDYRAPDISEALAAGRARLIRPHQLNSDGECEHCGMSMKEIYRQVSRYWKITCKGMVEGEK